MKPPTKTAKKKRRQSVARVVKKRKLKVIGHQPVVVSYGMGVDSTAMLVGMVKMGWKPDLILFANVGNEWPETYAFKPYMNKFLADNGFPEITTVQYVPKRCKNGHYDDLYGNCWNNNTLPSLAFGGKGCSCKWKAAPMDSFVRGYAPFKTWLDKGKRVVRLIGYDAGGKDSCRGAIVKDPHVWEYRYPLRDWGWDRDDCKREIEVHELAENHPDLLVLAVELEDHARPFLE